MNPSKFTTVFIKFNYKYIYLLRKLLIKIKYIQFYSCGRLRNMGNILLKKGWCLAVILLLATMLTMPIAMSISIKNYECSSIDKVLTNNVCSNDDYCYLGEWIIVWNHPLFGGIKPKIITDIPQPINCNFTEVGGKVTLKFKINISTYLQTRPIFPRWSGFHHAIYKLDGTTIISEDKNEMEWLSCKNVTPTFKPHFIPAGELETNGENQVVQLYLAGFGFPFPLFIPVIAGPFNITVIPVIKI